MSNAISRSIVFVTYRLKPVCEIRIIIEINIIRQHIVAGKIVFHVLQFRGIADKHVFCIFISSNS